MRAIVMTRNTWKVAALLFGSGACALIYQTVWLRQFRLIFGASTFATGAVLAIFMAGLGFGSARLGKRADARERPLLFYGNLEILIALGAALSPVLLWLAAKAYFASGGSPQLGLAGASVLRLLLATLVLGPATFLMGGTLPAAARAVATDADGGRHSVALLYAVNTMGAVAGALLSTFVLIEALGNRATLLGAVAVNLVVGLAARKMSGNVGGGADDAEAADQGTVPTTPLPVYIASALVGFSFLLMELVWYRMLSPILGGTTYMFGLILAVALCGIGAGGAVYAAIRTARATVGAFAITCSLEALAIAVPFALGDRLAILANVLRGYGQLGFGGHVAAWTLMTCIVVFPAACIAGYQFPLLIALLGRGREHVGRQIGAAYAWNTAGAIAGSLAGGFGILPLLSAPGTWRLVVILLVVLAAAAVFLAMREREAASAFATLVIGAVAIGCIVSMGPTAVWRHSGIGAARVPELKSRNELKEWIHLTRRTVLWEEDGRESSVALVALSDIAFFVNGKSDGTARHDAGTQVMSGLLGGALHPNPRTSLVVGLGTGSTAGWLGRIPSMERVDVIELEPVVLEVARACTPVNAGVLSNPKVHVTIGDAREVFLASDRTYDLIASEPSNPNRAGVASLFTHEFYEEADRRLAPGGVFLQWMQSYAVHTETMQTIYATLSGVFPYVQTWWTSPGDVVLLASREPIVVDAGFLRKRLATEPYRSALYHVWRTETIEQFLGHMIANEDFARAAAGEAARINTDDRTVIEFGFARSIDAGTGLLTQLASEAERLKLNRPVAARGTVDWATVEANRFHRMTQATRPLNAGQLAEWAMAMVQQGDDRAPDYIRWLARRDASEADIIAGTLLTKQGRFDEAAAAMKRALVAYRTTPWLQPSLLEEAIRQATVIGMTSPERARLMYDAMSKPYPVLLDENYRQMALITLASRAQGCGPQTVDALRRAEPHPFWVKELLALRADCYARANLGELADRAQRDLAEYLAAELAPVIKPQSRPTPRGSS